MYVLLTFCVLFIHFNLLKNIKSNNSITRQYAGQKGLHEHDHEYLLSKHFIQHKDGVEQFFIFA